MKRCSQCGTELPDNARFCGTCGSRLVEISDKPKPKPKPDGDDGGRDAAYLVPDAVRSRLEWWRKAYLVALIGAGLAYAFLPNVYRWTHVLYQIMDSDYCAPTLWLFWLPIVLTWLNCDIIDKSDLQYRKAVSDYFGTPRWIYIRAILYAAMAAWVCIEYLDGICDYVDDWGQSVLSTLSGPIVCGIGWCVSIYCLLKMRRIAIKNLTD